MEAKLQEEDGVYVAAGALGVSKHGGVCQGSGGKILAECY
jgi:hypothetical protein